MVKKCAYFAPYRPGQPDWKYAMCKLKDLSDSQILREINFGHFEAAKTAILTICAALNFEYCEFLTFSSVNLF